jgi:hypothetical protein
MAMQIGKCGVLASTSAAPSVQAHWVECGRPVMVDKLPRLASRGDNGDGRPTQTKHRLESSEVEPTVKPDPSTSAGYGLFSRVIRTKSTCNPKFGGGTRTSAEMRVPKIIIYAQNMVSVLVTHRFLIFPYHYPERRTDRPEITCSAV